MNTAVKRIVEAVRGDIFWSPGLPPHVAKTTKSDYYPGVNQLGHVLEYVRSYEGGYPIQRLDLSRYGFKGYISLDVIIIIIIV